MSRKLIRISVLTVSILFAWFYLAPYIFLVFSPFSWSDVDINKDGFISPTEAGYFADYGKREYMDIGKSCAEYYALKDGLPLKNICK